MDDGCGCIVVLLVLVGLVRLSTIIGDTLSIDTIWVFVGLIVLIIGLFYLLSYLLSQTDKKIQNRFEEIKNKYPKAYSKYTADKGYTDDSRIPLNFQKEVAKRSDYSWKNEEQTLLKEEQDRIKKEQDRLKKQQEEDRLEENRQMKEIECHYPNGLRIWKERNPMLSSNQRYMVRSREAISILENEYIVKEEQRKNEEKRIANQKREEQRIRLQSTAKDILVRKAKSWNKLFPDFHYTWFFNYYPTTCDFEASESEWHDRRTIWNFKNDPDRNISSIQHENALANVIPQIRQRLCASFGEEYLQFLTLVCLPASTKIKNAARYDKFSNRLCEETGMENAYGHVHIVKDGISKKDPNNTTGRSIQPVIEYDKDYFKGRNVLLFDDVVTRGDTMLKYKRAMEGEGATVIGGLCLGKTKHERPVQSGQNTNEYDVELPF